MQLTSSLRLQIINVSENEHPTELRTKARAPHSKRSLCCVQILRHSDTHKKNNIRYKVGVFFYSPTGITVVLLPASLHLVCRTLPLCTQLAEVYGGIYDSTDLQHQQWTRQRHETPTATNKPLSATRLLVLSHCLRNIVSLCASIPCPAALLLFFMYHPQAWEQAWSLLERVMDEEEGGTEVHLGPNASHSAPSDSLDATQTITKTCCRRDLTWALLFSFLAFEGLLWLMIHLTFFF